MKLKKKLQQRYEILEALASKDKKELRTAAYVAYNNVIEFPKPVAFTIKRLKKIIKEVEKAKLKGDQMHIGIMMEFQIPEELRGKIKVGRTFKIKSLKKKYEDTK